MSVVVKHITDPVPHILDVKPDLPADIEVVIEKAMAKNRDERFQTVKQLADALNTIARGEKLDLAGTEATVITGPKTVAGKRQVQTLQETVLSKRGAQGQAAQAESKPAGRKGGGGIVVGVVALVLILAAIAGVFLFRNKLPFLAVPASTPSTTATLQKAVVQVVTPTAGADTPTASQDTPTLTIAAVTQETTTETPAAVSPTDTVVGLPAVGGADTLAFLSDGDIWTMGIDGSNPQRITKDGAEKHNLQWAPDGQSIFYIGGKCVHYVTVADDKDTSLTCFTAADYLDSFEISPDGSQVAISLNHVLYVVPFDLQKLSAARNWTQLQAMNGCFTYGNLHNQPIIKAVRWSGDAKDLAADTLSVGATGRVDLVLVFDISKCDSNVSSWLDSFPRAPFVPNGYTKNPVIPHFAWDGQSLFLFNSIFRFEWGYLYAYNFDSKKPGDLLTPLKSCCYTAATWSPDGSYMAFAYQDIDGGNIQMYYIPYGSLGTGASYTPLTLPDGLFKRLGGRIEIALRPGK